VVEHSIQLVPEAEKDIKKLKIPNIEEDLSIFFQALPAMLEEKVFHTSHKIFKVANLGSGITGEVYIAKKIHCEFQKSNDKLRVVFQVNGTQMRIIEIYSKSNKEIEDVARIHKYCRK